MFPEAKTRPEAAGIVGRSAELEEIVELVVGASSARETGALIVAEPGMGKTTVWSAVLAAARASGAITLVAQPAESDARRSFSGLADLLAGVDRQDIDDLPSPQRRALDVALLRVEPAPGADDRAVGPAVLGLLAGLASRASVVVAIDDVQWLDPSTADAMAFALRRLRGRPIRLLLARRSGRLTDVERQLRDVDLRRIDLPPLSLGAIRRLILDRVGLELPRPRLRELYLQCGGNPLFAIELAAARLPDGEDAEPAIGSGPVVLDELLGIRLAGLPRPAREIVLALGLAPTPLASEVEAAFGRATLDAALDAGVVATDGETIRPSHPLLASVARGSSSAGDRRRVHAALAAVTQDPERRLRHAASAATSADAELAEALDAAGDRAAGRRAAEDAMDLAREALRLTPAGDPDRASRLIVLAERLLRSGDQVRAVAVAEDGLALMPAGPARARARLVLVEAQFHVARVSVAEIGAQLDAALAEAPTDAEVLAEVLARRSHHRAVGRVEHVAAAEREARRALDLTAGGSAGSAGSRGAAEALHALAWVRHLRGRSITELRQVAEGWGSARPDLFRGLDRIVAEGLLARGHVGEARSMLEHLLGLADERGEMRAYVAIRLQLIELELRAGRWARAEALLDEWIESPERELTSDSGYERTRSLLAGGRGDAAEAERWARAALAHSEARGLGWDRLESLRASGLAALASGRAALAVGPLLTVWSHGRAEGVVDPGVFPVAPDLVEALVETGQNTIAHRVASSTARLGARCDHPWAAVTGRRGLALIDVAAGDAAGVDRSIAAGDALGALGLPFDRARTFLALGRRLRRLRRWGDARLALTTAREGFAAIGSPGWVEVATSELERIGGRRPGTAGTLTAAERQVAALAADGLANKEIASALAVSVDTVERHLSRVYAKLEVQSRSQLSRRLGTAADR